MALSVRRGYLPFGSSFVHKRERHYVTEAIWVMGERDRRITFLTFDTVTLSSIGQSSALTHVNFVGPVPNVQGVYFAMTNVSFSKVEESLNNLFTTNKPGLEAHLGSTRSPFIDWKRPDETNPKISIQCALRLLAKHYGKRFRISGDIPISHIPGFSKAPEKKQAEKTQTRSFARGLLVNTRDPWDNAHFPDGERKVPQEPEESLTFDELRAKAKANGYLLMCTATGEAVNFDVQSTVVPNVILLTTATEDEPATTVRGIIAEEPEEKS